MPSRFCSRCGTKALPRANFCSECGASLAGERGHAHDGWRITTFGSAALGFFLLAGLSIWTVILSPEPPQPGPGGGATPSRVAADEPAERPRAGVPLPDEVKEFIADLAAKAKKDPKDIGAWTRLAQVYSRAAQLDPAFSSEALAAHRHVLDLDPENTEGLLGVATAHYDRDEYREAIPYYERYLKLRPDDARTRTDLGTMHLHTGDMVAAVASYREAIRRNPSFLQAHYNLAIAHHRQGDTATALAELKTARSLAGDDDVRKQIDESIAALERSPVPATDATPRSPFQNAVETAFRASPIMGERIVAFEWSTPASGRVLVRNFPMDGMPPAVREKFAARLGQEIRSAQSAHEVRGPIRMEIADASSGAVMATVTP